MFDPCDGPPLRHENSSLISKIRNRYLLEGRCKRRVQRAEEWFGHYCTGIAELEEEQWVYDAKVHFLQDSFLAAAVLAICDDGECEL